MSYNQTHTHVPKIYITEFLSCAVLFFPKTVNHVWDAEAPALKLVYLQKYKGKIRAIHLLRITVVIAMYILNSPSSLLYTVFKAAYINPEELRWDKYIC